MATLRGFFLGAATAFAYLVYALVSADVGLGTAWPVALAAVTTAIWGGMVIDVGRPHVIDPARARLASVVAIVPFYSSLAYLFSGLITSGLLGGIVGAWIATEASKRIFPEAWGGPEAPG